MFEAGRDLKVVSTIAVGYNNIDVAAARERNVVVTNTPDVLTEAAADLTWSLILSMTRRIVEGDRLVTRRGQWKDSPSTSCSERTCATSSSASSGSVALAGGCRPRAGLRDAGRVTPRTAVSSPLGEFMPLDRLLSTSDVVSLHCPLTPRPGI